MRMCVCACARVCVCTLVIHRAHTCVHTYVHTYVISLSISHQPDSECPDQLSYHITGEVLSRLSGKLPTDFQKGEIPPDEAKRRPALTFNCELLPSSNVSQIER